MVTIAITHPGLNFNAGHFTIFSETNREDLHGHSYFVQGEFSGPIDENGLAFDYKVVKKLMMRICDHLDEKVLLPENSPHLKLSESDGYIVGHYGEERMMFLPRDVLTLPVRNVTLEELSGYFATQVCSNQEIQALAIEQITMTVMTKQGQSASTTRKILKT